MSDREFIIKLIGSARTGEMYDQPLYVRHYIPAAMRPDGTDYEPGGVLDVTRDVSLAKVYPSATAAFADYKRENGLRPDGRPNRPMTSYHVEICPKRLEMQ
jgi:hypothetical protein